MIRSRRATMLQNSSSDQTERRMTRHSAMASAKVPAAPVSTLSKKQNKSLLKLKTQSQAKKALATEKKVKNPANQSDHLDSAPNVIVGRDKERNVIRTFIQTCVETRTSRSLYVSGAPGTGKTAVILSEAQNFQSAFQHYVIWVNCMQLSSASELFNRIISSLDGLWKGKENQPMKGCNPEDCLNRLPQTAKLMIILDEVDQLSSKNQELLYRIFDWPAQLTCHVIIIGIANALDLPERLLPRLKGKSHQPRHLAFPPYTRSELTDIVSSKLRFPGSEQTANSGLDPLAVQLCARKISASTGDVRTALNICRRAVDLAKQESRQTPGSPAPAPGDVFVKPSLKHISMALKESQGVNTGQSMTPRPTIPGTPSAQHCPDIPLHHKLVIVSLYLLRKQKHLHEVSFSQLLETYTELCRARQLIGLEESELGTVCGLLDARGHVNFHTGSTPAAASSRSNLATPARAKRVRLRMSCTDIERMFADEETLFASLLHFTLPSAG